MTIKCQTWDQKNHTKWRNVQKTNHGAIFEDRDLIFFTQPLNITEHGMVKSDFKNLVNSDLYDATYPWEKSKKINNLGVFPNRLDFEGGLRPRFSFGSN